MHIFYFLFNLHCLIYFQPLNIISFGLFYSFLPLLYIRPLFLANALTKLFPVLVEFKKVHVASFPPAAPVPAITAAAVTTKGKSKGKSLNNETLQQQQQQQQQQQGLLNGSVHQMEEV